MNSPENKNVYHDDSFSNLREALEDETLLSYLATKGPLRIGELPHEINHRQDFQELTAQYGWPNAANAGDIAPTHDYEPDEFWRNLYDPDDSEAYLNNFRNWLTAEPELAPNQTNGVSAHVEVSPALHRAHIVAKPLFENLREALADTPNEREAMTELGDQHPEVKAAAYAAYHLLGRLITRDDANQRLRALGETPDPKWEITDAHQYLWR